MFKERKPEIQKLEIPGEDLRNWIKVLLDGGLSGKETDEMLLRISAKYASLPPEKAAEFLSDEIEKFPDVDVDEELLERIKQRLFYAIKNQPKNAESGANSE